ncbi:hypothetical protein MYAM1_000462 [Malassezia yamatoensis]|uniref:HTH La-type RNA-binding domain-containing protein n=1 Tax=Malassezia yamatoensis TaxID=253288 RepID=A0AAJ5YNT0_9BASI|nr:hypothetical protein MYAM1_000462 [Malassezia yamatoensis]
MCARLAGALRRRIGRAYDRACASNNAALEATAASTYEAGGFLPEGDESTQTTARLKLEQLPKVLASFHLDVATQEELTSLLEGNAVVSEEGRFINREDFVEALEILLSAQDVSESEASDEFVLSDEARSETSDDSTKSSDFSIPKSKNLHDKARFLYRLLLERVPLLPASTLATMTPDKHLSVDIDDRMLETRRVGIEELRYAARSLGEKPTTAERLRLAADQKAKESNDAGMIPESSETKQEGDVELGKTDEKNKTVVHPANGSPEKNTNRTTSPTRTHQNVWETRMQQRAAVQTKKAAATPHNESGSKDTPFQDRLMEQKSNAVTCSTNDPNSTQAAPRPAVNSAIPPQAEKQLGSSCLDTFATEFPEKLPDSDVWLERIHLLNGGRPVSRYGKSSSPSTSANQLRTDSHEDPSPRLNEHHTIPVLPVQDLMGQRPMTSDGSYAPIRSSDHHNTNHHAYAQAMGSAPMNCYPMLPMPLPAEYMLHPDDRNWNRRNRENRSRGRGTASRGRANAMPMLPPFPFMYPQMGPYMMMPATAMPPSNIPKAASTDSTNSLAVSPAISHAESQGNIYTDSDEHETRPKTDIRPLPSSPENTGGEQLQHPWNAHLQPRFMENAFLPPSQQLQGMYPNYQYMFPPQPMVGQFDPRTSPMILPPGAFQTANHPGSGLEASGHQSTAKQMLSQLEFYFSDANLEQDFFLRQQMNRDGFVLLKTILNFKRVQSILQAASDLDRAALLPDDDLAFLRDIAGSCPDLELNEQKTHVRKRHGWTTYVLPKATQ